MDTVVVPNTFNGRPMFTVYKKEDVEMAKQLGKNIVDIKTFKPVVNMGMKKVKAIVDHSRELAEFAGVE